MNYSCRLRGNRLLGSTVRHSFALVFFTSLTTQAPSDCLARTRSRSPPAHHFLSTSAARLVVSVRLPSQLVSHLGERFCITSPDSLQNSSSRSHPACRATAADNTQTSHLQFPGAESSLRLTLSTPMEANSSSMIALSPSPLSPTPLSPSGLADMQVIRLWFLLSNLDHCYRKMANVAKTVFKKVGQINQHF